MSVVGVGIRRQRVSVILACRNRSFETQVCLQSLFAQGQQRTAFDLSVTLVDDGSSDDTIEMLASLFPSVQLIRGNGNLYWARAMALAEDLAVQGDWDHLLWLNDDVRLDDFALENLLELSASLDEKSIVVGATRWRETGKWSYGGAVLVNPRRPTSLRRVFPRESELVRVDAFNGNVVCIPRSAHVKVGRIDGAFSHGYADIDYGLRARKRQVPAVLSSASVGTCDGHTVDRPWKDAQLSRLQRVKQIFLRKGIPVGSHWRFVSRHSSGVMAPAYFVASYYAAIREAMSSSA